MWSCGWSKLTLQDFQWEDQTDLFRLRRAAQPEGFTLCSLHSPTWQESQKPKHKSSLRGNTGGEGGGGEEECVFEWKQLHTHTHTEWSVSSLASCHSAAREAFTHQAGREWVYGCDKRPGGPVTAQSLHSNTFKHTQGWPLTSATVGPTGRAAFLGPWPEFETRIKTQTNRREMSWKHLKPLHLLRLTPVKKNVFV